jgi:hypothetical protein
MKFYMPEIPTEKWTHFPQSRLICLICYILRNPLTFGENLTFFGQFILFLGNVVHLEGKIFYLEDFLPKSGSRKSINKMTPFLENFLNLGGEFF